LVKTESDRTIKGKRGIYAYYKNPESNYLCFIVGANGKLNRLNIGSIGDSKSMLYNVLINLPKTKFIKADLNHVLETRIVENRQPVKACMDILEEEFKAVESIEKIGSKQFYQLTTIGKTLQKTAKKIKK